MVNVNMNTPAEGGPITFTPGVDLWRVEACSVAQSRKGHSMLKLEFRRVSNEQDRLYDTVMLEGGGWGIGKAKLGVFLPPDYMGDLDPLELVGQQVWAETVIDEYTGKDGTLKKKLAVNIDGLNHGGYAKRDQVPPGCALPEPVAGVEDEEVPF